MNLKKYLYKILLILVNNILKSNNFDYFSNVKLIPLSAGHTNLKYYSASYKKSSSFKDIIEKVRDTYIFDT